MSIEFDTYDFNFYELGTGVTEDENFEGLIEEIETAFFGKVRTKNNLIYRVHNPFILPKYIRNVNYIMTMKKIYSEGIMKAAKKSRNNDLKKLSPELFYYINPREHYHSRVRIASFYLNDERGKDMLDRDGASNVKYFDNVINKLDSFYRHYPNLTNQVCSNFDKKFVPFNFLVVVEYFIEAIVKNMLAHVSTDIGFNGSEYTVKILQK